MITYNTLKIKNLNVSIEFGIPDNDEELTKIFKLRFEIYAKYNYIDPSKYPDQLEIDDYDKNNKCVYFITKINNDVIGSARAIIDTPLPTQLYFEFQEPSIMAEVPPEKRVEIGRLAVKPFQVNNKYLPRHLITLFIIKTLCDYGLANNFLAGYAFVTKSLYRKFSVLSLPIHKINNYVQKYPEDGVLYRYFNNPENPIIPIYYLICELEKYLDNFFNRWFFTREGNSVFVLNNRFSYNLFLKMKAFTKLLKFR